MTESNWKEASLPLASKDFWGALRAFKAFFTGFGKGEGDLYPSEELESMSVSD